MNRAIAFDSRTPLDVSSTSRPLEIDTDVSNQNPDSTAKVTVTLVIYPTFHQLIP